MNKRSRLATGCLGLALSLLLGAWSFAGTARPALAHPPRQGTDLVATGLAYAAAYDARDGAKMRTLADPAFVDVSHWGPPDQQITPLEQFIASTNGGPTVTLTNCKATGATTVACDATLSGGPLPALPHPWTETNTLTFANGKVLRVDEYLTAQTAADLDAFNAAHPAPGMPTTGAPNASPLPLGLLAGLLLAGLGLGARRRATAAR